MQTIDITTQADLIRVAHLLADAARIETLKLFRVRNLAADDKSKAEAAMREILAVERPGDGILGEEFGKKSGTTGLTWVLDPIDGTRGYISGTPTWGVLIAVSNAAGPQLGIIDQPYIGERFVGGFGVAELERRAFEAVSKAVKLTRYGMDCYGYALLAGGHVDLVIEAGLQPYDIHAPIAVIKAAGGVVSNWQGGAAHVGGRVIAAANADIHAVALATLQDVIDG